MEKSMREINATHYCVADCCSIKIGEKPKCLFEEPSRTAFCDEKEQDGCRFYHRKWPTPEQYQEEYGRDWSEDGAVYWSYKDNPVKWHTQAEPHTVGDTPDMFYIVCACTSWGKPSNDWTPE
jgi:hypothetical protein